jgi:hypothetical protein
MGSSAYRQIRLVLLLLAIAVSAGWFLFSHPGHAAAATAATGPRRPVLVELFTSEGCSSCPPADALLARLDASQFVPGAQAIVLSEHVTYWNQLGWRDPFSSDAMTERQQHYAAHFGLDSVYTPQAVVDGAAEMVGNDTGALSRAISRAALTPKADITIENVQWSGDAVHFSVRAAAGAHATLTVVLAEDATQSTVARGENAGRTLHHVAVVRALEQTAGSSADGRPLVLKLPMQHSNSTPLRLVAFLTSPSSGHVLAVAEQSIAPQAIPSDTHQAAVPAPAPLPSSR